MLNIKISLLFISTCKRKQLPELTERVQWCYGLGLDPEGQQTRAFQDTREPIFKPKASSPSPLDFLNMHTIYI